MALISLDQVTKIYPRGSRPALDNISLDIDRGEFVFLVGASGSGKTSLLRLLLHEEQATEGEVRVAGNDLRRLSNRQVPHYRRSIGFVFQDYKLLANKTVWENVAFALEVIGTKRATIRTLVPQVLETVGLTGKEDRRPQELSGGEQQRVAIARAYVNHPGILLADEPTGNLDPTTSVGIMEVLEAINRTGTTIVMATHNEEIVNSMRKRVIELHAGNIVRDERNGSYDSQRYFPDAEVEANAQRVIGIDHNLRKQVLADANALNVSSTVNAVNAADYGKAVATNTARTLNSAQGVVAPSDAAADDNHNVPSRRDGGERDVTGSVEAVAHAAQLLKEDEGIARLAHNVHSGRTGRYGQAFANVEDTLTWGKGLRLDEYAAQMNSSASVAPPAPPAPPVAQSQAVQPQAAQVVESTASVEPTEAIDDANPLSVAEQADVQNSAHTDHVLSESDNAGSDSQEDIQQAEQQAQQKQQTQDAAEQVQADQHKPQEQQTPQEQPMSEDYQAQIEQSKQEQHHMSEQVAKDDEE